MPSSERNAIAWFETLGNADVPRVGGKNASLGEMVRELARAGVRVPEGFATTAQAYRSYVEANGIATPLRDLLAGLRRGEATLRATGEAARRLFLAGEFPSAIAQEILTAYAELRRRAGRRRCRPRAAAACCGPGA